MGWGLWVENSQRILVFGQSFTSVMQITSLTPTLCQARVSTASSQYVHRFGPFVSR
jgi:hypothetical protein